MDWVEVGVWFTLIGSIAVIAVLGFRIMHLIKNTHSED